MKVKGRIRWEVSVWQSGWLVSAWVDAPYRGPGRAGGSMATVKTFIPEDSRHFDRYEDAIQWAADQDALQDAERRLGGGDVMAYSDPEFTMDGKKLSGWPSARRFKP